MVGLTRIFDRGQVVFWFSVQADAKILVMGHVRV